jgi:hypothetical protein
MEDSARAGGFSEPPQGAKWALTERTYIRAIIESQIGAFRERPYIRDQAGLLEALARGLARTLEDDFCWCARAIATRAIWRLASRARDLRSAARQAPMVSATASSARSADCSALRAHGSLHLRGCPARRASARRRSLCFAPLFIRRLCYEGFLPICSEIADGTGLYVLLPKLHVRRCVLEFENLVISRQTRRRARAYTLSINKAFDLVRARTRVRALSGGRAAATSTRRRTRDARAVTQGQGNRLEPMDRARPRNVTCSRARVRPPAPVAGAAGFGVGAVAGGRRVRGAARRGLAPPAHALGPLAARGGGGGGARARGGGRRRERCWRRRRWRGERRRERWRARTRAGRLDGDDLVRAVGPERRAGRGRGRLRVWLLLYFLLRCAPARVCACVRARACARVRVRARVRTCLCVCACVFVCAHVGSVRMSECEIVCECERSPSQSPWCLARSAPTPSRPLTLAPTHPRALSPSRPLPLALSPSRPLTLPPSHPLASRACSRPSPLSLALTLPLPRDTLSRPRRVVRTQASTASPTLAACRWR